MNRIPETRPSLLLRLHKRLDGNGPDDQAWSEFLSVYEPLIYRLMRRNGFQDADAQELTQEVFLAVAGAIERWTPDPQRGAFRGWLFRIARNLMINFLAKQKRRPQAVGDTDFNRLLAQQPAPASETSAYFDLEYKREVFRWAADRVRSEFHPHTWRAFWSTCVEECSIRQAAETLHMSTGAVYVARSRVMARLRAAVKEFDQESFS